MSVSNEVNAELKKGGAGIWKYNDITSKWEETGDFTANGNEISTTIKTFTNGRITSLPVFPRNAAATTFTNIDKPANNATVTGRLICNGQPHTGKVKFTRKEPTGYGMSYTTQTDKDGNFRFRVTQSNSGAYSISSGTWSKALNITSTDVNLGEIDVYKLGEGSFNMNGVVNSGLCVAIAATGAGCTGQDVAISGNGGNTFIIYNMPQGSSGRFNFNGEVGSCDLYALVSGTVLVSKSGTVTKTSEKSFEFEVVMEDYTTKERVTITGRGSYN